MNARNPLSRRLLLSHVWNRGPNWHEREANRTLRWVAGAVLLMLGWQASKLRPVDWDGEAWQSASPSDRRFNAVCIALVALGVLILAGEFVMLWLFGR